MKCKVKVYIGLSKEFIAVYVCLESILVDCMRHFADDNVLFVFACQKNKSNAKRNKVAGHIWMLLHGLHKNLSSWGMFVNVWLFGISSG